jgi:hypothetical protein
MRQVGRSDFYTLGWQCEDWIGMAVWEATGERWVSDETGRMMGQQPVD